jgi:hypothetical protein
MTLNTIELPEIVIAELYRNSLLATDAPAQPKTLPAEPPPAAKKTVPVAVTPAISVTPTADPVTPIAPPVRATAPVSRPPRTSVTPATPSSNPTPAPYKFLGNNGRNVTLVVKSPGIAYLPDEQLAFLAKMLEACKMNMGDVALVNHAAAPVAIAALKSQLRPSVLVLFGVEPLSIGLPINFPLFKIQPYDQCDYLYASSLEELVKPTEEGKLLKSKLWVSLRQLFGV